jgi:hypothetical protein
MPDDVDNALVAKLGADQPLLALLPNGAYFSKAPAGATRYALVKLIIAIDESKFGGRAFEDARYLVEACGLDTPANPLPAGLIKAAAARIDALLDPDGAGGTLSVPGHKLMLIAREERVRTPEDDDIDPSVAWDRRGGIYRVWTSPG